MNGGPEQDVAGYNLQVAGRLFGSLANALRFTSSASPAIVSGWQLFLATQTIRNFNQLFEELETMVTLSDGEAEVAGISLGGAETLLTIPVPRANLPAAGLGVSTVQIDGQWVQLGCPAVLP